MWAKEIRSKALSDSPKLHDRVVNFMKASANPEETLEAESSTMHMEVYHVTYFRAGETN